MAAAAAGGSGTRGGSWKTLPKRVEDCSDAPLPALLPTWLLRVLCRPRACAPGALVFRTAGLSASQDHTLVATLVPGDEC